MGTHERTNRTTILLLGAAALLATGCSGGSGADTTAGSAPATASATSSPAAEPPSAAVTPRTTPGSNGGKPASSRCRTRDLAVKPGEQDGAAGTRYQALVFTNTSRRTCTLYGYPAVSWTTGARGTPVGDPFQRGGTHKKVTVTLDPGRAAHTILQMPNAGNYDEATCKPVSVRGLRVHPPDETATVFVALPSRECSVKGVNIDTVWAISAGTELDP